MIFIRKYVSVSFLFIYFIFTLCSQETDVVFPFYDGSSEYLSMRQSDTLYTSGYRFFSEQLDKAFPALYFLDFPVMIIANSIMTGMFLYPITHEEAHRAILTAKNIGAVSQPIFNLKGTAYVKGVTDATLQNLRDTDLPMFIRLHTAGLESDYSIAQKDFQLMAFEIDKDTTISSKSGMSIKNLYPDYWVRIAGLWIYEFMGLADSSFENRYSKYQDLVGDEEENELERDIVGHDVYGMIHHLFNPEVQYQRYISFSELTEQEKEFSRRIGWRSFINFITPLGINKYNFKINDNMIISGSAGYCIAPFGDFIDENIFFKYDKFNIGFYARQAQNRNSWFPAFGLRLVEYKPVEWFSATVHGHFWMQPENLDFNTNHGVPGGAGEVSLSFVLPSKNDEVIKGVGINIGALYKTKGFMPEIESHDAHFRLSAGLVVRY